MRRFGTRIAGRANRADLLALRDRLEKAQAHAQAELDKAIGRLESTERRSMMEIERARQESAKKVEDAEARLKTAEDKNLLDATRLSKQIQDGRDNAKRMQDRINVLERDKQMLLERATRAEVREREMKTQNEKLLAKQARPELRAGVTSGDPIRLRKLRAAKKPQGQ
jgi:TolA-binding protein